MKNIILNILRWVGVIPAFVIVWFLVRIISSESWIWIMDNSLFQTNLREIDTSKSLEGHYFIGSLYVFWNELISISFAFWAAVKIAPKYRRQTYFVLLGIMVLVLMLSTFVIGYAAKSHTRGEMICLFVHLAGLITGTIISFNILSDIKYNNL